MRIIVMFDLPMITGENRTNYNRFRKYLIKSGFMMLQESVYVKMVPNSNAADALAENIKKNKPKAGIVQLLKVTEKQYAKMDCIVGETKKEVLDSDERLVIL